ncbi:carboxymuconolactone decarboxylase family protein [Haloarcula nitratireducens]|uniref:Carboxymuconolactone decarboxylase family protein n=1 Tax=Haloarcula nitratireducens TaxID=2487749 RepID=A0AAW4P8D6_9EURY|nr:carboxymuconolactone decarboxylase family protein [Halomicroarcula nitratireducens]MBX0293577.1 carboxymuconolactone decarboxylase family protein [Halomicroarcula nitratireducens]
MATQESPTDVEREITETFGMVPTPLDSIPEDDMAGEWHFFRKYTVGESEIPPKYRELMGLAVAANIKCPYCIHFHREAAAMHGATDEELEEVVSLASLTSRYSAMIHALEYDLDQFKDEVAEMADHLEAQAADD